MLQRSARASSAESDDSGTPSPKISDIATTQIIGHVDAASLSALSSPSAASDSDESAADRADAIWVGNIRVIEALRRLIQERLEKKMYEEDDDTGDVGMSGLDIRSPKLEYGKIPSSEGLYPTLRVLDD